MRVGGTLNRVGWSECTAYCLTLKTRRFWLIIMTISVYIIAEVIFGYVILLVTHAIVLIGEENQNIKASPDTAPVGGLE